MKIWTRNGIRNRRDWSAEHHPGELEDRGSNEPRRCSALQFIEGVKQTGPRYAVLLFALAFVLSFQAAASDFNVLDYGAKGDGTTLDTAAIQQAIDAAGEKGGRVVVPRGHRFLVATLVLKPGIEFHLSGELLISTNRSDYSSDGVITASNAPNLKITGTGRISGQSLSFMTGYDAPNEWWLFKDWRPKIFLLTGCTNLLVRDVTFGDAPFWGLHLLACKQIQIEHVTVENRLDVPNCDGIDLDHCTDARISACRITSGDDAIVIKATRQPFDAGPSANISVENCVLKTQDSGLKIGTETTADIHDITFEHCSVLSGSRGLTIQLRDEGNVYNIAFRHIMLIARYYSDPWWGRGEAVSLTAFPRTATNRLGTLHHVEIEDITGRAENSVRICGSAGSRPHDISLKDVSLAFDRWTHYPGRVFDNRPTKVLQDIEPHDTSGIFISHADDIRLKDCRVAWGTNCPDYFTSALEAQDVTGLQRVGFSGQAAHPGRDEPVSLK